MPVAMAETPLWPGGDAVGAGAKSRDIPCPEAAVTSRRPHPAVSPGPFACRRALEEPAAVVAAGLGSRRRG